MVKPKEGRSFTVTFKDGSVSMLLAKTADEAVVRARMTLIDAPVPDGEMDNPDPGIGCVESQQ